MSKPGSNMVFVVGCPRSGTTWVHRLLCAHPSCRMADSAALGLPSEFVSRESGLFVRGFGDEGIMARVWDLGSEARWVEKTPAHAFELARMWRVLPGARFVLVERNAADVVWSMMQSQSPDGTFPLSFDEAVRMWSDYRRALAKFNGWTVRVRYEDLHDRLEDRVAEVYGALGLEVNVTIIRCAVVEGCGRRGLPEGLRWCIRSGRMGDGVEKLSGEQLGRLVDLEERGWSE